MSLYRRHVLPRLLHLAMGQEQLVPFRRRVIGGAAGLVLEIGVGSGLNLPFYGAEVREVIGLDPSPDLLLMARRSAEAARIPVDLIEGSAESLPIDAHSIDSIVLTWTLCSIPDARRALSEMRRVLKPGGSLHFVEHGRAPEPRIARWQDRLDPLWRWVAGGCHLNRKMDDLIAGGGFQLRSLANARLPGPRTHTYLYEGEATPT